MQQVNPETRLSPSVTSPSGRRQLRLVAYCPRARLAGPINNDVILLTKQQAECAENGVFGKGGIREVRGAKPNYWPRKPHHCRLLGVVLTNAALSTAANFLDAPGLGAGQYLLKQRPAGCRGKGGGGWATA